MKKNTTINLPEKWAIRRDPSNYKELNKWFTKTYIRPYKSDGTYCSITEEVKSYTHDYMVFPLNSNKCVFREIPKGYQTITWETFRVQILNKKPKEYEIY